MFTSGIVGTCVAGHRIVFLALVGALGACDDAGGGDPGGADALAMDATVVDATPVDADVADMGIVGDAEVADMGELPDAMIGPAAPTLEAPIQATPEAVFVGPVDSIAALDSDTFALSSGGRLWWIDSAAPVDLAEVEVVHAATWFDDLPVIAADGAVWVLQDDGLARSPLSDEVANVRDLAVADGALWLAGSDGLFRFVDGMIQAMVPQDLPSNDARLTADGDDLWIGSGGAIYAITPEHAQPTPDVSGAGAPIVDATGVWVVGDGRLWWLDETLFWWPIELPMQPTSGAANPAANGVWLTDDAGLWLLSDGSLFPYLGTPVPRADADPALTVDDSGAVLIAADDGLWRVTAERFIRVNVPPDRITRPADVAISPALPAQVATLTATVDDAPIAVRGTDPWMLTLDPGLGEGVHTLRIAVEWADGEQAEAEAEFTTHTVNWAEDIHPLNVAECAMCHGQGGTARPLHTAAQWSDRIDEVLNATQMARMPLDGPLTPQQIQLIIDWQASGLLEDRP